MIVEVHIKVFLFLYAKDFQLTVNISLKSIITVVNRKLKNRAIENEQESQGGVIQLSHSVSTYPASKLRDYLFSTTQSRVNQAMWLSGSPDPSSILVHSIRMLHFFLNTSLELWALFMLH